MKIKLKINFFLFFLLFCFSLNAQIIVPLNSNSNATTSDCTSFDFDCGLCIQEWNADPPIEVFEADIFDNGAMNCDGDPPEFFEVHPGSSANLSIRFRDLDTWEFDGNCGLDETPSNQVATPNHTVTFRITEGTRASFAPIPDPLPAGYTPVLEVNANVSVYAIDEIGARFESNPVTVYFSPVIPAPIPPSNTVNINASITDNAVGLPPVQEPATEVIGTRQDPIVENAYTYNFILNNGNTPLAMKKSEDFFVPSDSDWTFMSGQTCYNYTVLNACPASSSTSFDNEIITELLFGGELLFSISDLNPTWLTNNSINASDPTALEQVSNIMFPNGFYNTEASWVVCNETIEDCHGFITSPNGFNLDLTTTTVLDIFKVSAVNNDRAGYTLVQNFKTSTGTCIGTATIDRIIARKQDNPFTPPQFGFYIKKQHNICD